MEKPIFALREDQESFHLHPGSRTKGFPTFLEGGRVCPLSDKKL